MLEEDSDLFKIQNYSTFKLIPTYVHNPVPVNTLYFSTRSKLSLSFSPDPPAKIISSYLEEKE